MIYNHEIERTVLTICMHSPKVLPRILDLVPDKYFYLDSHKDIYSTIRELHTEGKKVDHRILSHHQPLLKDTILDLHLQVAPKSTPLKDYIGVLKDNWQWRLLEENARKQLQRVADRERPDDIYALSEKENQAVLIGTADYTMFKDKIPAAVKRLEERRKMRLSSKDGVIGVASGLSELDRRIAGFTPPEFVIIAGRPAMGKSALKKAIEVHASKDGVVLGFALEMDESQEEDRAIAQIAGVDGFKISSGRLDEYDFEKIAAAYPELEKLQLIIDDTPAISISELKARARAVAIDHDLKMITIDYLQLMTGDKGGNREQEVSGISRQLKELAKELNVPIIALAQLSRAVETRGGDKKPILSDLRESGSLEQDSDTIIFLYRPEYYGLEFYEDGMRTEGIAELIIAKQRKGPTGVAKVGYRSGTLKFEDLHEVQYGDDNHLPFNK